MRPGPDYYYKCPQCSAILKNRSLMSGNTFGATRYSDGRCIAPMLPDIPKLTKCGKCDKILWLSDLEKLGECRLGAMPKPEWQGANKVNHLELHDLWRALEEAPDMPKQRELFVRQRIWWAYNAGRFETALETDRWRQNCLDLINLLDTNENNERCMAAELHRNLGNFSQCLELIRDLPEKFNSFKERMTAECEKANMLTFRV